jgi:hypothetical protein
MPDWNPSDLNRSALGRGIKAHWSVSSAGAAAWFLRRPYTPHFNEAMQDARMFPMQCRFGVRSQTCAHVADRKMERGRSFRHYVVREYDSWQSFRYLKAAFLAS